jgi:hypothetical protein
MALEAKIAILKNKIKTDAFLNGPKPLSKLAKFIKKEIKRITKNIKSLKDVKEKTETKK